MNRFWVIGCVLLTATVVKFVHQDGIAIKCLWCGDVLDTLSFPQSVAAAKSWNARFSRDAGTGQYEDLHYVAKISRAILT